MEDLERLARRAARGKDTVSATLAALGALGEAGVPAAVAVAIAARAASKEGRSLRDELYAEATLAAVRWPNAVALCVAVKLHRSSRGDRDLQALAANTAFFASRPIPSNEPLGVAILEIALGCAELAARSDDDDFAATTRCMIEGHLASRVAECGRPHERLRAVERLEMLAERSTGSAIVRRAFPEGSLLHNVARAVRYSPVGTYEERLARSRHWLELALVHPERAASERGVAMTRAELSVVLRQLAGSDGPERARALLGEAYQHARLAHEIAARRRDPDGLDAGDARRNVLRIDLARARLGEDVDVAAAFDDTVRRLGEGPVDPREASLLQEACELLGRPFPDLALVDRVLAGLVVVTRSLMLLLPSHVRLTIACLAHDLEHPRADRRDSFAHLLGLVDTEDLDAAMTRAVREAELAWLSQQDPEVRRRWVGAALQVAHGRIADVLRPSAERRTLGSSISGFAAFTLADDAVDLGPSEHLRVADLLGAAAYRADATFFGGGPLDDGVPHARRVDLHRSRITLDLESERVEPGVDPSDAYEDPAPILRETGDGGVETIERPVQHALATETAELATRWRAAVEQGWAREIPLPLPDAADLERWMRGDPGSAVLVAHPDPDGRSRVELVVTEGARLHSVHLGLPISSGELIDLALGFSESDRYRTRDGRALTRDDVEHISIEEARAIGLEADDLDGSDLARADEALADILERARPLARAVRDAVVERRIHTIRVLARGPVAWLPWEAIPLDDDEVSTLLGEVVAFVHVPTLAALPALPPRASGPGLGVIASADHEGHVSRAARAVLRNTPNVLRAPFTVDHLSEQMSHAQFVRFVAHGTHLAGMPSASGLELDDADDKLGLPQHRLQACELRGFDLRGVSRIEAWACEAMGQLDLRGALRGEDEPPSFAAAALVAGAGRVVAAQWPQPVLMVAFVGEAFASEPESTSAADDARRLARAIRAARELVASGSPLERFARDGMASDEGVRAAVLDDWVAGLLGPLRRRDGSPVADALAPLRRPWAYAGWRVMARDRLE